MPRALRGVAIETVTLMLCNRHTLRTVPEASHLLISFAECKEDSFVCSSNTATWAQERDLKLTQLKPYI